MKRIKALTLIAIISALVLTLVLFSACSGKEHGTDPENTESSAMNTEEPVITASPDGEVTASPTKEPDEPDDGTEAPVITASPDGEVTASPTKEPDASAEPGVSAQPGTTGEAGPIATIEPVNPGTSAPTAIPFPTMSTMPIASHQPTNTPSPTTPPTATEDPYNSPTCPPINDYEAHYAGATVDCKNLKVGDSFYWTFDLTNEGSRLWSGHWLIDYDERYLRVDAYSTSWSGGLTYLINQTWDNETATSDKPAVVCNPEYMGQTGGKPLGVEGNMYANTGMYLTSFQFYGVQSAGSLIRFKFVVKELPANSVMKHDNGGYYLEIPILIYESTATIDSPIYPGAFTSEDHGIVTSTPGKLYFAS